MFIHVYVGMSFNLLCSTMSFRTALSGKQMTVVILINHSLTALWFLIYWPDEDALSIVKESNVVSPKEGLAKGQV